MLTIVLILVLLAALYLLMLWGRVGYPGLEKLRGWKYAHRGLHGNGVPENSLEAFRAAVAAGYGAELDVHLLSDGGLAVIHDSKLIRTTGADGRVEDLTTAQIKDYRLEGTQETIPTFQQVLKLFEGKAPLIIELKPENNVDALCAAVAQELDGYKGVYCIESFHPMAVAWFRKNKPEVVRGQLAENFFRTPDSSLPQVLKFVLTNLMGNLLARPDFIAYRFEDRREWSNRICLKWWRLQGVSWTIRSQEDLDQAEKEGLIPIFEYFRP